MRGVSFTCGNKYVLDSIIVICVSFIVLGLEIRSLTVNALFKLLFNYQNGGCAVEIQQKLSDENEVF